MFGGGQERGLRPGTLPVHLVAALGEAAQIGAQEFESRKKFNERYREQIKNALAFLEPKWIGDQDQCVPNILAMAIEGIDSEAFMLSTKDMIAISNGSACTSHRYEPSHVLKAMGIDQNTAQSVVRVSWSHSASDVDWSEIATRLAKLK